MSFAITGAVIAGVGAVGAGAVGVIGSAALGAAGLGVSAASGLVGGIGSIASGAGSLIFGAPAAGVTTGSQMAAISQPAFYEAAGTTVGAQMAAIAQPAFYETAGAGILGGVASSASQTIGYLGELAPAAAGLYSLIKPPEQKVMAPAVSGVAPSMPSPLITKSPLPIFSQSPKLMTVGKPVAKPTNYILYIGLAALVFFLLRKK